MNLWVSVEDDAAKSSGEAAFQRSLATIAPLLRSLGGPLPTFAGAGEPVELWSPRDQARLHLLRQAVDPGGMFAGPSPA